MTDETAKRVLADDEFLGSLPKLLRILDVPMPIRDKDMKIVYPKPGYNPELEVYCVPLDFEIEIMTPEEGKKVIDEAFKDFCFKGYDPKNPDPDHCQSRVHMVARFLTPWC